MPEESLGLTFGELIARVADELGLLDDNESAENGRLTTENLALCKQLVNDGVRRFANAYPKWRFLDKTITLNLVANRAEYDLPYWFSDIRRTNWVWRGESFQAPVQWALQSDVMELRSRAPSEAGSPRLCCSRREMIDAGRHGYKAVFWPTPSEARSVECVVRAHPNPMSALSDVHIAGMLHDDAVTQACLAEAERYDAEGGQRHEARYQESLAFARALDDEARPRNIGYVGDASGGVGTRATGMTNQIRTVEGVDVIDGPY